MGRTIYKDSSSYVYVLTNKSIPGMVKVGYTARTPEIRAKELSRSTGVPTPYRVERQYIFTKKTEAQKEEKRIHQLLQKKRVNNNREFFKVSPNEIDKIVSGNITSGNDQGEIDSFKPSIPLCPKCHISMVLRTAQQGFYAGGKFWGCRRYPLCKEIIDYDDHVCQPNKQGRNSILKNKKSQRKKSKNSPLTIINKGKKAAVKQQPRGTPEVSDSDSFRNIGCLALVVIVGLFCFFAILTTNDKNSSYQAEPKEVLVRTKAIMKYSADSKVLLPKLRPRLMKTVANKLPRPKEVSARRTKEIVKYSENIKVLFPEFRKERMIPKKYKKNKVACPTVSIAFKILDADSFQTAGKKSKRITLHGINAPEKGQPFYQESKAMLKKLIYRKKITVTIYSEKSNGTHAAVVFVGKKNVNKLMVKSGCAWVYRVSCTQSFCDDWIKYQEGANLKKIGLWNNPTRIPPWIWK